MTKATTIKPLHPGEAQPQPGDQVELRVLPHARHVILATGAWQPLRIPPEAAYQLGQLIIEAAIAAGGETKG